MSRLSHRAAAFAVALSLLAPAAAFAQEEDPGLSEEPPVELDSGDEPRPEETGGTEEEPLADTGAEPALVGFAGLGLLLAGTGLRLRLRPPAHGRR